MRILGIVGSTRKGGNTESLMKLALKEARDQGASISLITLRDRVIQFCNGCMGCVKFGNCVIMDDMQGVYREMIEADGIIWGTPVYFWSMSALTKVAFDRTYCLGFPKLQLMNKVGGLILVAGSRGCVNTANVFQMYFSYNHMFFTEFAWAYAQKKGDAIRNSNTRRMVRAMVRQMICMINSSLKYPENYQLPLFRHAREK